MRLHTQREPAHGGAAEVAWPLWLTEQRAVKGFWVVLVGLTLLRVAVVLLLPVTLTPDETYYWQWGQNPAWGYFSKPPGIGWLMALVALAGWDSDVGIRLVAVGFGTGGLVLLFWLGSLLYNARVGFLAAVLFGLTPAAAALAYLLTIDGPLVVFWTGAAIALWGLLHGEGHQAWRWATLLAVCWGGGLLFKPMMAAFFPLALLAAVAAGRKHMLGSMWLWGAFALGGVALVPMLIWNSQNGWVTIVHTSGHLRGAEPAVWVRLVRFGEFAGAGLLLLTPVVAALVGGAAIVAPFRWSRLGSQERFLWVLGGPGMIVFLLLALWQRVQPNWPAVFVLPMVVLISAWVPKCAGWFFGLRSVRMAWATAGLFFVGGYLIFALLATGWVSVRGFDPLGRLQRWEGLASEVDAVRAKVPNPQQTFVLTCGHRWITSSLAFYLDGRPDVYQFPDMPGTVRSQFDLWPGPVGLEGWDAVIVGYETGGVLDPALVARFDRVERVTGVPAANVRGGERMQIYLGQGFQGWAGSGGGDVR